MSLIRCINCGAFVSSEAKVCPNCGRKTKGFQAREILYITLLVLLLLGLIGWGINYVAY